ncbi:unnamed protein product [Ambrosiozyma monospora]|uniref:Unnamed protein product n=1 Tax=Ambrosiozyma monospora TaxID=43982 RepID=A0A9W6YXN8_AMBMO|nr:unnamed protein product [Ambrosiozyma monospora]
MGSGTKHHIKKRAETDNPKETATEELTQLLTDAITYAGFTHLDTAESYTTEVEVGEAIKRSKVDRSKLWITSKYDSGWRVEHPAATPSGPYEALTKSLKKMDLEYLDLYLIHSPFFHPDISYITVEEAWMQMEKLVEDGKAKNIGVSNFNTDMLEKILRIAKIKPQVDQIEFHLYLQNQSPGIVQFCQKNDILVEAYSPLTPILPHKIINGGPVDELVEKLIKKYGVTKNQLILRWVYQSGVLPVTTSSNKDRLKEALGMFNFTIGKDDFTELTELGTTFYYRGFFNKYFEEGKIGMEK